MFSALTAVSTVDCAIEIVLITLHYITLHYLCICTGVSLPNGLRTEINTGHCTHLTCISVLFTFAQVIMYRCLTAVGATHAESHSASLAVSVHGTIRSRWLCGSQLQRWQPETRWYSNRRRLLHSLPPCWPTCTSKPAFLPASSTLSRCAAAVD